MSDELSDSFDDKEYGTSDPEAVPNISSAEAPKKKRGWPKGMKRGPRAKKDEQPAIASAKLPIPPQALQALGNAPYLLAGVLYNTQTKRSLDFQNPEEVRQMYVASLQALEAWMKEAGVEAPAWLVWAGTTSMCIGSAITIDQIKLRNEKAAEEVSRVARNGAANAPPAGGRETVPAAVVIGD